MNLHPKDLSTRITLPPTVFRAVFFTLCAVAAATPFLKKAPAQDQERFLPDWPDMFEQRPLRRVPLSEGEERFNQAFPGAVARFTDGERQFIFRWTTVGTRKLHSSADCFRGLGYQVVPEAPRLDGRGERWSSFSARRGAHSFRVRERITGASGAESWSDVSAWYWSALLRQSRGPWMAVTVIEPVAGT